MRRQNNRKRREMKLNKNRTTDVRRSGRAQRAVFFRLSPRNVATRPTHKGSSSPNERTGLGGNAIGGTVLSFCAQLPLLSFASPMT